MDKSFAEVRLFAGDYSEDKNKRSDYVMHYKVVVIASKLTDDKSVEKYRGYAVWVPL